jgi:hypothetical protein
MKNGCLQLAGIVSYALCLVVIKQFPLNFAIYMNVTFPLPKLSVMPSFFAHKKKCQFVKVKGI